MSNCAPHDHLPETLTVLGIETSCDDTAAAVIRLERQAGHDQPNAQHANILSNRVWSQHQDHQAFGGVVPEIAARSHVERLDGVIIAAMKEAGIGFNALDGVAVTAGPGLVGGVLVGLTTAKAIAVSHNLKLIPLNHLEGHGLSVRMTEQAPFPYLLLLVSGGHTQLIHVGGVGDYNRLGTTIDDAVGEAFDKTAKLLGLGQPGGPILEKIAQEGDPERFPLPSPLKGRAGCDFSFSGLKTAIRTAAEKISPLHKRDIADLAAGFQHAAAQHLARRTARAMDMLGGKSGFKENISPPPRLVIAGGVASNLEIRNALSELCHNRGWVSIVPPTKYCTDNGAMIAWAGLERLAGGHFEPLEDCLSLAPRARWPLAPPPNGGAFGGGRKGPKA